MRETPQTGVLEARPQGGASRQGKSLFVIAPLIPAHKAGIRDALPVNSLLWIEKNRGDPLRDRQGE
jgi:hypothetical protein